MSVALAVAKLLHDVVDRPFSATLLLSCLYVLNRRLELEKLAQDIIKMDRYPVANFRLRNMLLKTAWLLQNDELLDVVLGIEQSQERYFPQNIKFIAERKNAHPLMQAASRQICARLKNDIASVSQVASQESVVRAIECMDAFEDFSIKQDFLKPLASHAVVCRYLARQSAHNANWGEAEFWFEKAMEYAPHDPRNYLDLGELALRHADAKAKIERLLCLRLRAGSRPLGYDVLQGLAYILQGDYRSYLESRDDQSGNAAARQEYGAAVRRSMGRAAQPFSEQENSAFVIGRDGVSDEVRWSYYYSKLLRYYRHVGISCDPRLLGLFRRSFPKVDFYPVKRNWGHTQSRDFQNLRDKVPNLELAARLDNAAFDASKKADEVMFIEDVPVRDWKTRDLKSPPCGGRSVGSSLIPEVERAEFWLKYLDRNSRGKLKVGLIWRSGMINESRRRHYMALKEFAPLAGLPISVYSIQHQSTVAERLEGEALGFHFLDEKIDFYNDFEAVAALTAGLDLVIGISSLPYELAAAVGTECWLCAISPEGKWLRLGASEGNADRLTLNGKIIYPRHAAGYLEPAPDRSSKLIQQVIKLLQDRLGEQCS
ncbi:hypothetical protein [Aliiroseovarius lamellibrachiae]|uniref:hypothetical protein n=1 Tax=Aliiroseovarius lamellibrachiae TaxID=1924933 RepID=UPI001BDF9DBE|nr:hypothetical protein [Aliiroseovarius lamellibrachiae]MBT2131510.1 hypothetical protein [Aliiroseovarius lamellibrachiae]